MRYKVIFFILFPIFLSAKHIHKESYYQKIFCNKLGGTIEYRLKDKSRIDCLTLSYAIEVDFIEKWAESIGQSLFYSIKTNTKPAVLIIQENNKHPKNLQRLKAVAQHHNIRIWTIDQDLKLKLFLK